MRFLFLFSDTGGGHRAGAEAVREALLHLYDTDVRIDLVDVFKELGRWPFRNIPRWYPYMVGLGGIPWHIGYRLTNGRRRVRAITHLAWPYTARACKRLLQSHPADVIVSFHAVPNYILAMARRRTRPSVPLATVTLDLVTVHAAWFAGGHDLYIVPTEEARDRAERWCAAPHRLEVIGMPTRRRFAEAADLSQEEARARLELPQQRPLVLFIGGGEGMGPLAQVVQAVMERQPAAHLAAITGRNLQLYTALSSLQSGSSLQVEGFVHEMEVWMRAADLIVTKAGPNTLAETFIAGRPLILYSAIPGQETGNVDYVVKHGAGIWAPQPEKSAEAVLALLNSPERRREMGQQARSLARPQAAATIAQNLYRLGMHRCSGLPRSNF
jgi:1,2-diacylglycerol 3-beta-galactosyltransferase